jgi:hypothetical protein
LGKAETETNGIISIVTVAKWAAVIGGASSFGNFILNLSGVSGISPEITIWLQGLSLGTFLLAILIISIDYEMKRDKWPSRISKLMGPMLQVASMNPEYMPEPYIRVIITSLRAYYRMALSEGRNLLAEDFLNEIQEWETQK